MLLFVLNHLRAQRKAIVCILEFRVGEKYKKQ